MWNICETLADNGLRIGEVADFKAQMLNFVLPFNRITTVEIST